MKSLNAATLAASVFTSGLILSAPAAASGEEASQSAFRVTGSVRLRHETLSAPYRAGRTGSDQHASWRIRILGEYDAGPVTFGAELLDARTWLTDSGSVLPASSVNAVELYQAYVVVRPAEGTRVQLGRYNMSIGSGRLAAQNGYVNSPNSFVGARLGHKLNEDWALDAFYGSPVPILPRDRNALLNNTARQDEVDWDTRFWAAHLTRANLPGGMVAEAYLFGLNHANGTDTYAPGARLLRAARPGRADFEAEAIFQTGSRPVAGGRQDIKAGMVHLVAGYTFEDDWRTRLSVQLVYASGDRAGGDFNRFNSMYGGRRGDFGPTAIFGPIGRENLITTGVRYQSRRGPVDFQARVQEARLAVAEDSWTRAGLRDASGQSGRRIGIVADAYAGYNFASLNTRLEAGAAYLAKGRFARNAPGAPDSSDVV
ncbi:MAG: alginate export family protein [Oceanicaulis sp.]|nr:alginate export family protein [Oceanicaulis sp.]